NEESFRYIIYCAGGGPFGDFAERPFHSHIWALQVSFLAAMKLLHQTLQNRESQFIAIGSLIAEHKADIGASSYAAAKSALAALLASVAGEGYAPRVGLVSVGYMDTSLLPPNAWPRQQGIELLDPTAVANEIWRWLPQRADNWRLQIASKFSVKSSSTL